MAGDERVVLLLVPLIDLNTTHRSSTLHTYFRYTHISYMGWP